MRRVIDDGRPLAHVAEEMGISRQAADKWVRRYKADPVNGLADRPSRPKTNPTASTDALVEIVLRLRVEKRWGAARAAAFLQAQGWDVSAVTCHRIWERHGMSRLRDFLPDGTPAREQPKPIRVDVAAPGNIIHIDVKKVGKIPHGGGWWAHGRGSEGHLVSKRKANTRPGKTCIHAAVDAHSRLAYVEQHDNETADTVVAFWHRAVAFFAAHGITTIRQVTSDNGPAYKSRKFAAALKRTETRHRRTKAYTPKQNGKVEAFNGLLKREVLQARTYTSEEERRDALVVWVNDYNHLRPHGSLKHQPPITRVPLDGGGVMVPHTIHPPAPAEPEREQLTIFEALDEKPAVVWGEVQRIKAHRHTRFVTVTGPDENGDFTIVEDHTDAA